jgi:aspartokinase-like uncharacterized kinase
MWVVKLGGSLARNGQLRPWIQILAGQGEGDGPDPSSGTGPALAVVPGGGLFADRVREMQASWDSMTLQLTGWQSWPWSSTA